MNLIRIQRDSGYADRVRAYKVVVDGNVIGEIKNGQQIEFQIEPGRHELYLKVDWCQSHIIEFEMKQDDIEFECGSNLRGLKIFLSIFYVTFFRKDYIWLRMR